VPRGELGRQPMGLGATRGRQHARYAAQEPLVADRDQPSDQERAGAQPSEHGRSHVRTDAIGQFVDQVHHDEGLTFPLPDLEDPLHHVSPAEEQGPFLLGQLRVLLDEELHHRAAVRQAMLQDESIEEVAELRVVHHGLPTEAPLECPAERARKAWPAGEVQERTFEVSAPLYEVRLRPHRRTSPQAFCPTSLKALAARCPGRVRPSATRSAGTDSHG
jgi:hypothetical protein